MARIVRKEASEQTRPLALRESNVRPLNPGGREAALVELGRLAAGDSGKLLEALWPRVELDASHETRRVATSRAARRSSARTRRDRRRDLEPKRNAVAAEVPRVGAGELFGLCRALTEVVERLDALARTIERAQAEPVADEVQASGRDDADESLVESDEPAERGYPDGLTRREVEVLLLVAEGRTSKEIAAELCVAVPTVSRHLANTYSKIGARCRADATRYALENLRVVQAARSL